MSWMRAAWSVWQSHSRKNIIHMLIAARPRAIGRWGPLAAPSNGVGAATQKTTALHAPFCAGHGKKKPPRIIIIPSRGNKTKHHIYPLLILLIIPVVHVSRRVIMCCVCAYLSWLAMKKAANFWQYELFVGKAFVGTWCWRFYLWRDTSVNIGQTIADICLLDVYTAILIRSLWITDFIFLINIGGLEMDFEETVKNDGHAFSKGPIN